MNLTKAIIFYLGIFLVIGVLYSISPILCGIVGLAFSIWLLWGLKGGSGDARGEDQDSTGNW